MRPTALGWKGAAFFAALVGAFFAAPYSNLYFMLMVFLGCLGVLGTLWTAGNLRGVEASLGPLAPMPAGGAQPFVVDWDGGGRAHFDVRLELDLGKSSRGEARAEVVTDEQRTVGALPALPRGVYPLHRAFVYSTYPLGLARARRAVEAPTELVVYPRPADLPEARSGGELVAHLSGDLGGVAGADQPSGLREFRDGDELRSVHWRASARRGTLVVKEWEGDAARGLEVVLDRRCEAGALEEALSLVCALALVARDEKEALTLHTQGASATYGGDHEPWNALFRLLAAADALPPGGPAPPAASPAVLRLPVHAAAVRP